MDTWRNLFIYALIYALEWKKEELHYISHTDFIFEVIDIRYVSGLLSGSKTLVKPLRESKLILNSFVIGSTSWQTLSQIIKDKMKSLIYWYSLIMSP